MTPWQELLAAPPEGLSLRYRTGSRKSAPGETLLSVSTDGRTLVENRLGTETLRFASAQSAKSAAEIFAALARAGFPGGPIQTIPPGAGIIAIELPGGPAHAPVLLHRSFLRDHPAWLELVRRLDDTCVRATNGAIRPA